MRAWFVRARNDIVGGLVSAAVAIPLAMGYGMFAFVALGDAYFAHGVLAGLYTAIIVGVVSVATGDRTTTLYAPRIVTTFFLASRTPTRRSSGWGTSITPSPSSSRSSSSGVPFRPCSASCGWGRSSGTRRSR
jgi:MFS superfamily sulfate permease-like transporter